MATALQPWGRLKLVSADSVDDADHTYLYRSVSVVGRDPQRADVLLSSMLISSVHCRIDITGKNDRGEPIVMLEDLSRNRIWANEELIGKGNSVQLTPNATVHFTKPGALQKMSPPMVYVFELLWESGGWTPENERLRAELDQVHQAPNSQPSVSLVQRTPPVVPTSVPFETTSSVVEARRSPLEPRNALVEPRISPLETRSFALDSRNAPPQSSSPYRPITGNKRSNETPENGRREFPSGNKRRRMQRERARAHENDLKNAILSLHQQLMDAQDRELALKETITNFERTMAELTQKVEHIATASLSSRKKNKEDEE